MIKLNFPHSYSMGILASNSHLSVSHWLCGGGETRFTIDRKEIVDFKNQRSKLMNQADDASSAAEPEATPQLVLFNPSPVTVKNQRSEEFLLDAELPSTTPLPVAATPRAARTGPIKTGGRVFVLDHNKWPEPMRNAIDGLLAKHHGSKDLLKKWDAEYAAMVQTACTDPNSLLHPTTKQHISSENTAPFNPPAKSVPEAVPLDQAMLEKMVRTFQRSSRQYSINNNNISSRPKKR
ncbi:hypothetical protein E1301_Tti019025 [Triplophysa tibetana]|uniref:Uncharacterized protein n=1 Tax=Triplophysa tibetana TaxID=1572043 RepID=A0A5A9N088_9TELE|nr:hypothetical protein E1301_Tti019025 [Triplophysa tibetana]